MAQIPPYTITMKAADYLTKIAEAVTRLEFGTDFKRDIRLHRQNRVRSIYSSLAIEGNTLSLVEVSAVIEGKLVRCWQEEVKEVKNAFAAYDKIMPFNQYSVKDFLKGHKLMTDGLVKESGRFRSGDVGVFDGDVVVHVGARPQFVSELIEDLFAWAKESELHPVLKGAVLHCEIETIHPFADGNGRMGRLWQTLLLAKLKDVFQWIPMESVVFEKRPEYYDALQMAQKTKDANGFIEFILSAILETVEAQAKHQDEHKDKHQVEHQDEHQVEALTDTMLSVLLILKSAPLSRKDIFAALRMNGDTRAFRRIIEPLLSGGHIEMTVPDKPNSKLQKYRLTDIGRAAINMETN